MRTTMLIITALFALINVKAQDSFSIKFMEANTLIEENQYNTALPIWLKLLSEQPDNNNINYKIGLCYLESANEKSKALDYLINASENISKKYNPFSFLEKNAPLETYFYLAKVYHLNTKIDSAIKNYTAFKGEVSKKHYLFNEIDRYLAQCENAKKAMAEPLQIKISNMGGSINSKFSDYSPVISIDESTMYFTSRRIRKDSSNYYKKDRSDGQHYKDIYVTHKYDDSWSSPEIININTRNHDAVINLSTDGQTLFVYKDDAGDGNIYISKQENEKWSSLVKLGSNINEKSNETHAHISPDNNILYFVSDRDGGLGGKDIYMCKKLPNGQWALAQNLGSSINTPYDEAGVFIHPDGKTMYFSSKGHTNIGGYDIFSSTINEQGEWSNPINLGYPINTTDNDVFFVTSSDGERAYYSSFQKKGYGEKDIYQIELNNTKSKSVTLLSGYIKLNDTTEMYNTCQVEVTNNETGKRVGIYKPRDKDGKFSLILISDNDYHITYSNGKYKQEEDLYIPANSTYQEMNSVINLADIVFDIESPKVVNDYQIKLDELKVLVNGLDALTLEKFNKKQKKKLVKLKKDINALDQLKEEERNKGFNDELAKLKNNFEKIKASKNSSVNIQDNGLVQGIKTDNLNEKINLSYQYFFDYNNIYINTFNPEYIKLIKRAIKEFKASGKVKISIEASASYVPTKKNITNTKIANNRAKIAKATFIASLGKKGIKSSNIIILNVSSNVNGPSYKGDFENTVFYQQYQFVKIKIH